MAKQLELQGRQYWILSEPLGERWKASVVEVTADGAREAIGCGSYDMAIDAPLTARALLTRICFDHPALGPHAPSLRLAVNGEYALWDRVIRGGDEVAIIPPVAGG